MRAALRRDREAAVAPDRGSRDHAGAGERFSAVLAAATNGEHWALEKLFRANQPRLQRYLWAAEPRVADDFAADVWISIARRLHHFEGDEAAFWSWLFGTGRKRVGEHRRRHPHRVGPDETA